jgi:hypothetical protein
MLSNRIGFCLTEAVQRLDRRLAGIVDAARVGGGGPLQLALATQIGFEFSNSVNTPSMSTIALPTAMPVSTGCSVAFSAS